MRNFLLKRRCRSLCVVCGVADGVITDYDFHVSTGFIYWLDFSQPVTSHSLAMKLSVHRIKPDGTDYAEVVSMSAVSATRNFSAMAINWVEGTWL